MFYAFIIDKTVEITVAKMNNTFMSPTKDGGKNAAAFMQVIYDKLSELNAKKD